MMRPGGYALWLVAAVLVGCAREPYANLLADARAVSSCEAMSYVSGDDQVYVVEGCGKTLRMECLSEWNEPWCCHPEGTPPRQDCDADDSDGAPRISDKAMPGLNTPP